MAMPVCIRMARAALLHFIRRNVNRPQTYDVEEPGSWELYIPQGSGE
jgi:hypothetical protein